MSTPSHHRFAGRHEPFFTAHTITCKPLLRQCYFPNDTRLGMLDVIFNSPSKSFNMIFPVKGIGCNMPIGYSRLYFTSRHMSRMQILVCYVPSHLRSGEKQLLAELRVNFGQSDLRNVYYAFVHTSLFVSHSR